MDYAKRVENAYHFVLKDLKAPNKRLIRALAMQALEDIKYKEIIVQLIEKHVLAVDAKYKLNVFCLIDSIVKTIDGAEYRTLFGEKLSELMIHILKTSSIEDRELLCKMRQTWNKLFTANVLNELDEKVREVDSLWPHTLNQRKMIAEKDELDKELALIRKEINQLVKEQSADIRNKTKRRLDTVYKITPKRRKLTRDEPKSNEENCLNSKSSVFLTPERDYMDTDF